ncbi:MAG: sensor histidine kinase [Clostridia bacterium]|nr:sensor histidine kinase [Clostridia bacterium]
MKELSLNILDIAENSLKAKADTISIILKENEETLQLTIVDNGCGMDSEFLEKACDPFTTTRTTRDVGLGIPFLKLAAEQTGGTMTLESVCEQENPRCHGTTIQALFYKKHIDATPLGDIVSTLVTLIQGNPSTHWVFQHVFENGEVTLDTAELTSVLGEVPLDTIEVLTWIREYLNEQYGAIEHSNCNS